jgi:hypothetical protein
MPDEKDVVKIPDAPAGIPPAVAKKWKEVYSQALIEAANDCPNDAIQQKQAALREANRLLRVPEPKSHADAVALADWHVMHREEKDGHLRVVTIEGKKFKFPVPKKSA